ncbi:MAG: hypothetical protein Q4G50_11425 [Corynebacterium sp.]|uniref:hypothetical protein n=1 Tax=Corynebacterium sp. TaxID=1720 RepID=UPI0026DED8ED|nr:hypothetical protein [Corynebacterium sp.]MDO5670598.1 hypothetical protein [Corynebacterium sp.]
MNQFDAINDHLHLITLPEDRALVQRWFLNFLTANRRFSVLQAAEIAVQVAQRWGMDVIRDCIQEDWIVRPLPATRREWEADGYRVPREARPLLITGDDGRQVELFPLFDVDLVREDLVGSIDHDAVRDPEHPDEGASDLAHFALHIGERERHAFSHLWKVGTVLEWADVSPDAEDPHLGPLGWIESNKLDVTCAPEPGLRPENACYCLRIHPDAEGPEIVGLGLSLSARLLTAWTQGRRAGEKLCGNGESQVSDLEVGIVTWLVGKRLSFGTHHANVDTLRFIENHSVFPAPRDIDWGRIVETAMILEDLLCGKFHPNLGAPPPAPDSEAVPGLTHDPFGVVGTELAMNKAGEHGEAAERWMLDFVAENPRFPMGTALALGWQLYQRWGLSITGDESRLDWIGTVDVRPVEEWALRGWVPRPGAPMLVAPGTHGQPIYYLLRDDAIVADRLTALRSDAEVDSRSLVLRPGPADAPKMEEFSDLVTPDQLEMLRNLWRGNVIPVIVNEKDTETESSLNRITPPYRLPVVIEDGVNPMHDIIEHLSNWVLAWELGVIHSAPVVGWRYWVASEWESALVAHVAACRLGIGCQPSELVEQALSRRTAVPGLIRWGLIYHAAGEVEDLLRGFPSGPPVRI